MQRTQMSRSRREFLKRATASTVGGAFTLSHVVSHAQAKQSGSDRFHFGLHQFSLKKLIDEGKLDPVDYAPFVKKEFGITHVEFAADFYEPMVSDEVAEKTRKSSQQHGITNRAILCTGAKVLDAVDEKSRKEAVDYFHRWAKAAERMGCRYIRVRASTEGDAEKQLNHAADGLTRLSDRLDSSPVSLLIENIVGHSRDPDWMVALIEKVGRERLGLVADFANFNGDIYDGMRRLLPYAESVCTKSWEFDEDGNETEIDYARMMNVINESPFRGCISIEYLGDDPLVGIEQTANLVRRYW